MESDGSLALPTLSLRGRIWPIAIELPIPVADLGFVKGGFTNVNVRKYP